MRVLTGFSSPGARRVRPYLPLLVGGLLFVHIAYIAPGIVGFFIDDALALMLSGAAVATIQIILLMLFFYLAVIPVMDTLRGRRGGEVEAFLAAPVTPGDVLLGKYLGQLPLYAVLLAIITGFFTAVLDPLGLGPAQMAVVVTIFVLVGLSGLWIGTVVAAILGTRLEHALRGRNIGKAVAVMIPLPAMAVAYAMIGGGLLEALADPAAGGAVTGVLGFLPSSWGVEVIVGFASSPGGLGALGPQEVVRLVGLVAFFVVSLWTGAKLAGRGLSLELETFTTPTAKADGAFYATISSLGGGGTSGTILVSVFKDYVRRLENLTNITYVLGLFIIVNVFMISESYRPGGPPAHVIILLTYLPVLAAMVTGDEEIWMQRGLLIYRRAPSGVGRYVRALLTKSWLLSAPIAAAMTCLTTALRPESTMSEVLSTTVLIVLICLAYGPFILGIYLLNPAFSEKFAKIWLNAIPVAFASLGIFLASVVLIKGGLSIMDLGQGDVIYILLAQASAIWLLAIVFLYLGLMKVERSN